MTEKGSEYNIQEKKVRVITFYILQSQFVGFLKQISPGWFCSWLECRPSYWRVPGSIPAKGMHLGCRLTPGPGWGACRRQPLDVCPS